MHARARLGRAVEGAVAGLYRREGFQVESNVRAGRIEVDLVAWSPGLVVFVEVKARRDERFGSPAEAVTPAKQARIRRAAGALLAARSFAASEVRFDVVSAIVRRGRLELDRITAAF